MTGGVLVVGAGHAGGTAAALLRQYGYEGAITLIGEEPLPPYQRPPLSKAWLKGETDAASLMLKPESFYAEADIGFRPNTTAVKLRRETREVELSTGEVLGYDHLIIATGARPIALPIPGADLDGILVLRTAADAEALKRRLGPGVRVAIIGGGYVGLEVAASAIALGASPVVIEREPRLLARSACPALSDFFKGYHESRGVELVLGATASGFEDKNGAVCGVRLQDGRLLDCDVAVVGVGAAPNEELAREAGVLCEGGIVVDLNARTSDPAVFAIGDVTRRPLPLYGQMFRPESVPNALEQAKQAACAIAGRPAPAPETPWFWSDQFDLKLQIAGIPHQADRVLLRGNPDTASFAVFHLKGDRLLCVEAVNAPPEFMAGKQLIHAQRPVSPQRLEDTSVSMKLVAADAA